MTTTLTDTRTRVAYGVENALSEAQNALNQVRTACSINSGTLGDALASLDSVERHLRYGDFDPGFASDELKHAIGRIRSARRSL